MNFLKRNKAALLILFFFANICLALQADLNGDSVVNFKDLAIFANDWAKTSGLTDPNTDFDGSGTVDYKDLFVLAGQWLYNTIPPVDSNTPPTVYDSNISTNNFLTIPITLTATDDGRPNPPGKLKYIITSLPTGGTLTDLTSGAGVIESRNLPYTLSTWGNSVWFSTDVNGVADFNWIASDYGIAPHGGDSNMAKVHITIAEHPRDYLSFDGRGFLTIEDSNYLDCTGNWGFCFWIKTRDVSGTILQKHATSNGFGIGLSNGKIKLDIWDSNNALQSLKTENFVYENQIYKGTINDGLWNCVCCFFEPNETNTSINIFIYGDTQEYETSATFNGIITSNNTAQLLIAGDGNRNTRIDIDRLSFWKNSANINWDISNLYMDGRTGTTYNWGAAPSAEWRFNEGGGAIATDSVHSLVATFSDPNHVRWYPYNKPFFDVTVQGAR